jgi:signal peptidase II
MVLSIGCVNYSERKKPERNNCPGSIKKEKDIVSVKRARLNDVFALLIVIVVIALDQWTKSLVVANLKLREEVPVLGKYLVLQYILNSGAAFSMFKDNIFLVIFIVLALGVVGYLYARILNTGLLFHKLIFALIIGGALGNLIDRFFRGGAVVDFVSFRVPEINFYFGIFNAGDACISIGVILLFVLALLGGLGRTQPGETAAEQQEVPSQSESSQP